MWMGAMIAYMRDSFRQDAERRNEPFASWFQLRDGDGTVRFVVGG